MTENEVSNDDKEIKIIPVFFIENTWRNGEPSSFIKSWIILILIIPSTAIAVTCLY